MHTLYPDIEPYATHMLKMEKLADGRHHEIYVEECGNPDGLPVVFLHGGPGSGCRAKHRCYFDPEIYRIILFDQRGCGRSLPPGELENNTTAFLISDMERIRKFLDIPRWVIFGGSWGATLGLCYAQHHPEKVLAMILRGVFLGRKQDIEWVFVEGGASRLFPDIWQQLTGHLPEAERTEPLKIYYTWLTGKDQQLKISAAEKLRQWEGAIVTLYEQDTDNTSSPAPSQQSASLSHAVIQLHYAQHECFLTSPLLDNIDKIRSIPTMIIHGRYDLVCPIQQSWELHQAWPESSMKVIHLAGHNATEPELVDALIEATGDVARQLKDSVHQHD